MKVSGFTFVRNAVQYDYPVREAIMSILPLCDEFVVCLGDSDDSTADLIHSLQTAINEKEPNKIRVVHSVWDDTLREGGRVLAAETDKAFDAVAEDSDWAFYIQADEAVHEKYLPVIAEAMERNLHRKEAECLVLKYLHFYGSYGYVGDTRNWYRREIRIIRNDKTIRSYRDAQGFRRNGGKLNGVLADAYVYHYGYVRNPYYQQQKQASFQKLWHSGENCIVEADAFDYSHINSLTAFTGTHPQVMQERIAAMDWQFSFDPKQRRISRKEKALNAIERWTGKRLFEFRNYRLI